jgi:hypothetical protein
MYTVIFWNPMGNSLEAYRSVIGMFYNCSRISSKCVLVQADSYRNILLTNLRCSFLFVSLLVLQSLNPNVNVVFLLFVLHFILMIGNVELNPGPSRCDSVITRISNSSANCWTKFVLFLILRILILHKEMELSFELLSKLGGELDM